MSQLDLTDGLLIAAVTPSMPLPWIVDVADYVFALPQMISGGSTLGRLSIPQQTVDRFAIVGNSPSHLNCERILAGLRRWINSSPTVDCRVAPSPLFVQDDRVRPPEWLIMTTPTNSGARWYLGHTSGLEFIVPLCDNGQIDWYYARLFAAPTRVSVPAILQADGEAWLDRWTEEQENLATLSVAGSS